LAQQECCIQGSFGPQIIEKAYAKYKGGYDKIEGGSVAEFWEALTGRPSNKVPGFMTKWASILKLLRLISIYFSCLMPGLSGHQTPLFHFQSF
jgi:hypothetical protein